MLSKNIRLVHTVVMVRHGESLWNLEKKFTGWCDIPLTQKGEDDAKDAGSLLGERSIKFDIAFTSTLERAWKTCYYVLSSSGQSGVETLRSWKLNERHYGALQGHHKNSPLLYEAFGEQQIIEWRRSYTSAPPSLNDPYFVSKIGTKEFERNLRDMNPLYMDEAMRSILYRIEHEKSKSIFEPNMFSTLNIQYPMTESLKQCEERAYSYWKYVIAPHVKSGKRVLIVAHANTIRALVKSMDNISDEMIAQLKIPNGIPLVYTLDKDLQPVIDLTDDIGFQANYLVSARNHGKMMAYERCVQKKLRSLFEYLDTNGDGRIAQSDLQSGITKLQIAMTTEEQEVIESGMNNYMRVQYYDDDSSGNEGSGNNSAIKAKIKPVICEYEVEELLRCIPNADKEDGITLQEFLDSEATIMPQLTRLRLLQ